MGGGGGVEGFDLLKGCVCSSSKEFKSDHVLYHALRLDWEDNLMRLLGYLGEE